MTPAQAAELLGILENIAYELGRIANVLDEPMRVRKVQI